MNETITINEVMTEFWALYLGSVRGLLLFLTRCLRVIVRIAFTVMSKSLQIVSKLYVYIEDWQPVIPAVFDTRLKN